MSNKEQTKSPNLEHKEFSKKIADYIFGIPSFNKNLYVNNYWSNNYALGKCDIDNDGSIKANANSLSGTVPNV